MAGYFGLTSFLDACVGRVLTALEDSDQAENTIVIYLSDHGELLGEQGLWTKQVLYEASVGIPLIMAGPDLPADNSCKTAVSLVDIAATAMDIMELPTDTDCPGRSLRMFAAAPNDGDRTVFSEYHDGGLNNGAFIVRWRNWKYVHYAGGLPPQLLDLASDPEELADRGLDPAANAVEARSEGARRLMEICDADAVDKRCRADQEDRIATLGGRKACQEAYLFNHTPTPTEQAAMESGNS